MSRPGEGAGWERLAAEVATVVPPGEVDALYVFAPLRHHQREFGTAIVARVDGDRRRIYTARYALQIKGKERGRFEAAVEEVGSGPVEALDRLVDEVRKRTDDEQPPTPIPPDTWFPPAPPEAPAPDPADGAAQPG